VKAAINPVYVVGRRAPMAFHAVRDGEPVMRFLMVTCVLALSCGGNSVIVTGAADGGSASGAMGSWP
jgi:hypothetical protein